MTRFDFISACNAHGIDPSLALENERIVAALRARNDAEVLRLLRESF